MWIKPDCGATYGFAIEHDAVSPVRLKPDTTIGNLIGFWTTPALVSAHNAHS